MAFESKNNMDSFNKRNDNDESKKNKESLSQRNETKPQGKEDSFFSAAEVDKATSALVPTNSFDIEQLEESIRKSSNFLNEETSLQFGAVILAVGFQNYNFWVGLKENLTFEKKRLLSKILLGKPSITSIKFEILKPEQFEKAFQIAYRDETTEEQKFDKEFRFQTRKTRVWGAKKGLSEEDRLKRIKDEVEALEKLAGTRIDISDLSTYHETIQNLDEGIFSEDDLNNTAFLKFLLQDFILSGASDLHCISTRDGGVIRYRYNKKMYTRFDQIPISNYNSIVNGLCTMAAKEPSTMKQRGISSVIKLTINDGKKIKPVEFRFQSNSTLHTPSIVLRGQSNPLTDINKVGFNEKQKKDILEAIHQDSGIVIVTGQTGSGKTNTLNCVFTILQDENGNEKAIIEIGSPIEIESPFRMQITLIETANEEQNQAVREKTFADALRSDPDVIGYTEIRTKNETNIAIRAAQTGHLVLTTLHAADVEETYSRLFEMNIDRSLIAKGVICIISQKLIRKLCPNCRILDQEASMMAGCEIYQENSMGCDAPKCEKGFAGATVVAEVLLINQEIKNAVLSGAKPAEISKLAIERGYMISLKQAALEKLRAGITSQAEIESLNNFKIPEVQTQIQEEENYFFSDDPIVDGELIA